MPSARSGPGPVPAGRVVDVAGLEALLAAALIRDGVDAGAEQRAVAAFIAAREAEAHGARTRRRDDWRLGRSRLGRHSLKATLSLVAAGLTLGGVAVAGIGATGSSTDDPTEDGKGTHAPSSGTTGPPTGGPADPGAGSDHQDRQDHQDHQDHQDLPDLPTTARDEDALCRAHAQVRGRGKALDPTAWTRLAEAAGGAAHVDAYCAERLEGADAWPRDTASPERNDGGPAGRSDSGAPGNASDNATRAAGNGSDGGTRKPESLESPENPENPGSPENPSALRP
ncbi:hypothetical protein ACIF9R_07630 [Streptomyces sp. NPDC086080]|uniref:hypothetical protein n=1 Tax=Streptomyces sp. NPDC086080 TaxID=3365748 RepID=UPI0037CF91E2